MNKRKVFIKCPLFLSMFLILCCKSNYKIRYKEGNYNKYSLFPIRDRVCLFGAIPVKVHMNATLMNILLTFGPL